MSITRSGRARTAAVAATTAILASVVAYRFGADATAPPTPGAVVPITPCRLADTRSNPAFNVGPRNTPLGIAEDVTFAVHGTNGNCTIPTTATGIIANVTIVNPTGNSFLTVYPADAAKPGASNLNWRAGQGATPNLVTVGLSADGAVNVYNNLGTVNVIIDITAYTVAATSPSVGSRNRISLDQIARLRWDQDPGRVLTYSTGSAPEGIAFDGTYLWIANNAGGTGAGNVSRMNPATGERTDFPTGFEPAGVAFDGTYIWVTNRLSGTVSKLDTATGAVLATVTTGSAPSPHPEGLAFDGTNIWVANRLDDSVTRVKVSTGAATTFARGSWPTGVVFDGTNIWVTSYNTDTVLRLDTSSGAVLDTWATGNQPTGIAYDGTSLWVANSGDGTVSRINPVTGAKTDITTGAQPVGVAFDGTSIWVTNVSADTVTKVNPRTGTTSSSVTGGQPIAVAYDGANVWVVHHSAWNVMRLNPGQ